MSRVLKLLIEAVVLIVVIVVIFVGILAWRGSWFRDVEPSFAGNCESLELEGSAEDIQLDRRRGIAYLSVLDRLALVGGSDDVQGTILKVNLNRRPLRAEPALASKPAHFRPHGLSLHVDPRGRRYLFALNHPVNRGSEAEMVELFRQDWFGRFEHVDTFTDPLFISPNDLVAVGPRQFYVANDKVDGGVMATILQQLSIGGSPLVYFDDGEVQVVLSDIASGGGINASADGNTLYVAETAAQRVRVLEREPITGDVTEVQRVEIGTSPDNIDVAPDGSLWIGAHANTLKLIQHFAAGQPAPSQVLQVRLRGESNEQEDIFLDDGRRISASSVGVNYDNLVLIGSITERKLLVCTLAS
ncbi:MAG: SMP-30/gluconolactonase/LRE family protein [Gammaproteobacteria bacterium]|nr:SMP-30/gluconolactonase/LRE family protein [Gammaproteobacteria bacterium]